MPLCVRDRECEWGRVGGRDRESERGEKRGDLGGARVRERGENVSLELELDARKPRAKFSKDMKTSSV